MAPTSPPSEDRPIVYLHIGSPKSGTTFIQQVLWNNVAVLREAGVRLPLGSFRGQQRATWDLRGRPQAGDDPGPKWKGAWNRLVEAAHRPGARSVVFSHETLAALTEEKIKRAVESLSPLEVHVVYTIRDLAGLLPSEWQEYVKHRCGLDYEAWVAEIVDGGRATQFGDWFWSVHDVVDVLRRWGTMVPPERMHVLTVPPPGTSRDLLWRRFADLIGVAPGVADLDGVFPNTSLGLAEAELLRQVNQALPPNTPDWMYSIAVKGVLAHNVLSGVKGRRVYFPPDRIEWVRQRQQELIDGIREGGYHVVGDLDELPKVPIKEHPLYPPTDAELVDIAVPALVGLMDEFMEQRAVNVELRKEVAALRKAPPHKALARSFSENNPNLMRVRVAYWHLRERMRRNGLAKPGAPAAAERPRLSRLPRNRDGR